MFGLLFGGRMELAATAACNGVLGEDNENVAKSSILCCYSTEWTPLSFSSQQSPLFLPTKRKRAPKCGGSFRASRRFTSSWSLQKRWRKFLFPEEKRQYLFLPFQVDESSLSPRISAISLHCSNAFPSAALSRRKKKIIFSIHVYLC